MLYRIASYAECYFTLVGGGTALLLREPCTFSPHLLYSSIEGVERRYNQCFNSTLSQLLYKHTPLKLKIIRTKSRNPWLTLLLRCTHGLHCICHHISPRSSVASNLCPTVYIGLAPVFDVLYPLTTRTSFSSCSLHHPRHHAFYFSAVIHSTNMSEQSNCPLHD